VQRKQQAAQLTPSPAVIDAQSPDEKAEAAQAALMTSATVQIGTNTYQVRRGDFHRHTELSFDGGGDGSLTDAYRYMIDAATLQFYAYLKNFGGLDAAHSTATDQGTNWNANDPAVETTVEIYQGARQSYEMPESPRANSSCDSIDTFKADGFVSTALAKGY